jgi:signal transduction histidine kinase
MLVRDRPDFMNAMSDWDYATGISREDADEYLRAAISSHATPVLQKHRLENSYCATTGVCIGSFTPIIGQNGATDLRVKEDVVRIEKWIRQHSRAPSEIQKVGDTLFLPIVGLGELFGFFSAFDPPSTLDWPGLKKDWDRAITEIADFNYARRVIALAVPLAYHRKTSAEISETDFLQQVARTTALSFGADAALIRLFDADEERLKLAAWEGDVSDEMISDRRPGEALSGAVLSARENNWALVEIDRTPITRGAALPDSSIQFLVRQGVRACLCARMDEPLISPSTPIGTVTYLFRRANRFSWRDVALFVGFTRRVADLLCLIRQAARLQEKTQILEIQAPVFTQAELAHLLVHDLSHKVLDIEGEGAELQDEVRKEGRRYREQISPALTERFQLFQHSIEILKKEVIDLRAVGRLQDKSDEILAPVRFDAAKEVSAVLQLMRSVLDRQKITPHVNASGDSTLVGPIKVFQHVLLNFIINTVDAAKGRASQRPMTMHFSIAGDTGFVRLRIWDTGPGVDMSKFQSKEDVFRIGKTTKPGGTGMGLPVARTLLDRYFKGSIHLMDPEKALFELVIRK